MSAMVALAAQSGPQVLGVAIAFVGGLKFIQWGAVFAADRWDSQAVRVTAREAAVERRFNQRLKHVELELDRYRLATMKLLGAFAELDPSSPVLTDVAKILRREIPIVAPDPVLDGLIDRLADVPGTQRGEA